MTKRQLLTLTLIALAVAVALLVGFKTLARDRLY